MKRALVALAVLPAALVGCGSSSPSSTATASAKAATVAAPDASQIAQAHELAAKLGCQKVVVTPGGGAGNGSAEAVCNIVPPAGADQFSTMWRYDISVWPDSTTLAGYIAQVRAAYNPSGVQGDRWAVFTGSNEDPALANAKAKVGGEEL